MKILNLLNPSASDIKFEISKFPDGQQQIRILGNLKDTEEYDITIKTRLNNFMDLELIICSVKSIRSLFYGTKSIRLYVPYFLGSRSDRQFEEGSNNYLKDVICPIINSLNFESVTVMDPHSDVLEACLNNFQKESNEELIRYFMSDKYAHTKLFNDKCILVSPDAGASKKIYKLAEKIGYKGDIITCSKDRDTKGNLTKCVAPLESSHLDKDFIIIDDICDGGATFINIAKTIKGKLESYNKNNKIYLVVTHGIFSKGFEELHKYFDGIYCTNSYRDWSSNKTVLNVF